MENTELRENLLSLSNITLKVVKVFKLLFRKWYLLLLINLVVLTLSYLGSKYFLNDKFHSYLSFTLEQKNSGAGGALGGLASSLGLGDLPSASSSGMFGGENILHLVKSNRIIHQSLKEPQSELANDNLLNEYLKNHYSKALKKGKITLFPKKIDSLLFNRKMDSLLLMVTQNIRKNQIFIERLDKKTTIINLEVKDVNEKWAFLFSKALVKNAIDLYLEIKVGKLLRTEEELTRKRDSIRGLLDGSITTLAFETDMNSHTPLMRYKTKQVKKQIDVEVLKGMYSSVIQNLEMTKFQQAQEEPIIEIIDEPILPLVNSKLNTGIFLFACLFVFNTLVFSVALVKQFNQVD